jgi:hypothetical protein
MTRSYLWALLTLIIAIALAFILLSTAKDDSQGATKHELQPLPKCMDDETRDKLLRLTYRAVDQGYQRHVTHLFDVLMGTPSTEQFSRAQVGMRNGIKGYLLAQENINVWTPPPCQEQK